MSSTNNSSNTEGTTSLWSALPTLLGVALRRSPGLGGGATIPTIEVERTLTVDEAWLAAYRGCIGAVDDGAMPPCAPQVLAVGLHLAILRDPRFPLPALGMVHVENVIEEQAPIRAGATVQLTAAVTGHRPHDKGVLFDIVTEAHVDGSVPWRSVMTALVRTAAARATTDTSKSSKKATVDDDAPPLPLLSSSSIRVPADMGRRYARVAGDANPIHLTALTAKAFGFPRAIAHGMWTLGRSLSEIHVDQVSAPRRIAVRFIRPVLLPSTIVVEARRAAAGPLLLSVTPEKPGAPHILGRVEPL